MRYSNSFLTKAGKLWSATTSMSSFYGVEVIRTGLLQVLSTVMMMNHSTDLELIVSVGILNSPSFVPRGKHIWIPDSSWMFIFHNVVQKCTLQVFFIVLLLINIYISKYFEGKIHDTIWKLYILSWWIFLVTRWSFLLSFFSIHNLLSLLCHWSKHLFKNVTNIMNYSDGSLHISCLPFFSPCISKIIVFFIVLLFGITDKRMNCSGLHYCRMT